MYGSHQEEADRPPHGLHCLGCACPLSVRAPWDRGIVSSYRHECARVVARSPTLVPGWPLPPPQGRCSTLLTWVHACVRICGGAGLVGGSAACACAAWVDVLLANRTLDCGHAGYFGAWLQCAGGLACGGSVWSLACVLLHPVRPAHFHALHEGYREYPLAHMNSYVWTPGHLWGVKCSVRAAALGTGFWRPGKEQEYACLVKTMTASFTALNECADADLNWLIGWRLAGD